MLAAGVELGDRFDFDLVHGHDWLVAVAGDHLAKRFDAPLAITIHATEYGRHQGWVDKHPQSHIHGVEQWMANRAEQVIACSAYMRDHVADIYGIEEERIAVIPNGIDPADLQPLATRSEMTRLRGEFAAPRREARAAGRAAGLREGLPDRARGDAAGDRASSATCASWSPARARTSRSCARRPRELGLDEHGTLPRLDRRRRAAHALPDRRPDGGALDLRAVRAGRARGDGVGLPVPGRRHRRAARGRAARRGRPALSLARPALAGRDRDQGARRRRARPAASSPRPTSTCAASTGPTSPSRPRPSTRGSRRPPSRRA